MGTSGHLRLELINKSSDWKCVIVTEFARHRPVTNNKYIYKVETVFAEYFFPCFWEISFKLKKFAQRSTWKDFVLVLKTCTIAKCIILKEAASFPFIPAWVYTSLSFARNVSVLAARGSLGRHHRGQAQRDAESRKERVRATQILSSSLNIPVL